MNSKMLKKVFTVVCIISLVGSLAGCGKATKTTTDTEKTSSTEAKSTVEDSSSETKKEVTVTALLQQSRNYPGLQKMIDKLKADENIIVDLQIVPDDQYNNLLQMQINSGEAPDLIDYNLPAIYGLIDPETYLADLSDEAWVENLVNPSIVTHKDGKVYGFPFQASSGVSGIVYNKQVFEDNDIAIPTTEEEFNAVCDTLLAKGITPLLLPSDNWVPQIWMSIGEGLAAGSVEKAREIADALLTHKKEFTDYPELIKVVDTYLGMFDKGYFNQDYLTVSYDACLERLAKGEGAMLFGSAGILSAVEGAFPDAKVSLFNPPFDYNTNDALVSGLFSIGFCASKNSPKLDTVKRIFDLWSTPEYMNMWFEGNAGFPSFPDVDGGDMNDDVVALYNEYSAEGKIVGEMNNYLNDIQPLYKTTLWVYYLDAPSKGITGEELLATFQKDVNEYMKEKQVEGF